MGNGDLAVSRGFGDAEYKKTGGPGPEDRPVTANPELGHFECDETDFLLLVCDGVSEGDFPNRQVVQLVAEKLKETDDPGQAARAVCHKAVEKDSKDNITCMVVELQGKLPPGSEPTVKVEFNPGPFNLDSGFLKCYQAMAEKAGLSLAKAAELRYELVVQQVEQKMEPLEELQMELEKFTDKSGTPEGTKGSEERAKWFQKWLEASTAGEHSMTRMEALM